MTQPQAQLGGAAARLVRAARRPSFATGIAREAVGAVVTAGLWPLGLAGRVTHDMRRRVRAGAGVHPTPVLLLHGYGANSSYWLFVTHALEAAGFGAVHSFNYQPVRHDIETASALCVRRARALMEVYGTDRIHLVGHSAGGLVIRHAVQVGGLHEASTVVTVAAPQRGSVMARWGLGGTVSDMRPGSPLLASIAAAPAPPDTRFIAFYSNMDVVVPGHSAMITEPELSAVNHLVKDVGHLSILLARDFHRSLVEELLVSEGHLLRFGARQGAGAGRRPAARLGRETDHVV
jgi:pimeloyl-ACP methyl ester carboxylesterase